LLTAWAGALYFLQRGLIQGHGRAFFWLGLMMGIGLLAKYSMVWLAPAALVFMLIDRKARTWFARPQPYLGALLAALMFAPVLVWNHMNDWASFQFQGMRRIGLDLDISSHMVVVYLLVMLAPLAGSDRSH
jgi:dolichol-phosphate mannosyltransferase